MAQHRTAEHDRWQGYITVLVVNHGMIQSICILTTVVHAMIKFDLNCLMSFFRQAAEWIMAIC